MLGVHRIVEAQAAIHRGETALVAGDRAVTYRELNQRANGLARHLIDHGLCRGSRAVVWMERSPELAVALLAILKAGAAYTWVPSQSDAWPESISLLRDPDPIEEARAIVDFRDVASASPCSGPNLPILTRGHDIACVIPQRNGLPSVLVPHSTIAALLRSHPVPNTASWSSEPGALDLWLGLMSGATVRVTTAASAAAA